jgi:cell division GTPase FtsZ
MAALDALMSWIVVSLTNVIYGHSSRSLTVSDLRSVFKEGNEGTIFVGGSYVSDPDQAADEFISCGLLKRDPKTGKGYLINLVTPRGTPDNNTKPFVDAVIERVDGTKKTVFIGNLEDPARTDIVDLIGIITGMDDGHVDLAMLQSDPRTRSPSRVPDIPAISHDRWDIPMVR